jgi:TPR repeat protein
MTTRTAPKSQAVWLELMMLIALSGLGTVFAPVVTAAEAWTEYAQARVDSELDPLTASAENGDDDAQLKLGMRYYDGISREKPPDYEKALGWFRRAADHGN